MAMGAGLWEGEDVKGKGPSDPTGRDPETEK